MSHKTSHWQTFVHYSIFPFVYLYTLSSNLAVSFARCKFHISVCQVDHSSRLVHSNTSARYSSTLPFAHYSSAYSYTHPLVYLSTRLVIHLLSTSNLLPFHSTLLHFHTSPLHPFDSPLVHSSIHPLVHSHIRLFLHSLCTIMPQCLGSLPPPADNLIPKASVSLTWQLLEVLPTTVSVWHREIWQRGQSSDVTTPLTALRGRTRRPLLPHSLLLSRTLPSIVIVLLSWRLKRDEMRNSSTCPPEEAGAGGLRLRRDSSPGSVMCLAKAGQRSGGSFLSTDKLNGLLTRLKFAHCPVGGWGGVKVCSWAWGGSSKRSRRSRSPGQPRLANPLTGGACLRDHGEAAVTQPVTRSPPFTHQQSRLVSCCRGLSRQVACSAVRSNVGDGQNVQTTTSTTHQQASSQRPPFSVSRTMRPGQHPVVTAAV
ncbi:unnamed protein product [Protopolystoma xenopodis]|uniref:Uncharacterized protein n=1 Tax=Protopolystoma xenopodis TaxID=117903 RepID=A0A448XK64_9PLAT|nr:unnamed protein product [Protopolystoma xenopodis]